MLGATNRPNDIDSAILRRMPKRYAVGLPNPMQRKKILDIMLTDVKLDKSFDLEKIISRTDGLSGSDLKEACRGAAMQPVREFMRSSLGKQAISDASRALKETNPIVDDLTFLPIPADQSIALRPIRNDDFFVVDGINGHATRQEPMD